MRNMILPATGKLSTLYPTVKPSLSMSRKVASYSHSFATSRRIIARSDRSALYRSYAGRCRRPARTAPPRSHRRSIRNDHQSTS